MENLTRLRSWLKQSPYDGVVLGRRDSFTWLTEGNENAVVTNTEEGIGYLIVTDSELKLVADSSDAPRMAAEQNALGAEVILVPWYETTGKFLSHYCSGKNYGADVPIPGTQQVLEELIDLRLILTDREIENYREIGQVCAAIVEQTAREAVPGQTELEIAAILKSRCIQQGVSPDCVLVGSDERILNYRHPVPTDKKIEKSLMVVLGGEKYGLNISMTRMVYFALSDNPVPEEIRDRMQKTQYIFACMQTMMRDGMSFQEYFEKVCSLYKEVGWEKEWQMHHQGGTTGYACREFIATPNCTKTIHNREAFAWNPTIAGTKCEETTLLRDGRLETFTKTENWPRTEIQTPYGVFSVAGILVK